jgi:glycosyltransferase involved in cell wall biosynthesis
MSDAAEAIDIVIPAHNEGASIGNILREFFGTVAIQDHIPIRFVVCEDGSTDDTVPVIKRLGQEMPLKLISDPVRKGYSRAVIDGILETESEWIAFIDSDGQCDPHDFSRLVALREGVDLVVGWRNPRRDPLMRKAMSRAFGLVYRMLFEVRVRDPSCPYLLVHRSGLEKMISPNLGILKQGFWWEFLARASHAGLRITETPVRHRNRVSSVTKIYRPLKVPRIAAEHLVGLWKLRCELDAK